MIADISPAEVRELIELMLPHRYPTIDDVAPSLGVSTRTLQRRLSELGLTYFDLVQESRLRLARRLLRDKSIPIRDVSVAVGFADPSSFSRFFRRSTGLAPNTFRYQRVKSPRAASQTRRRADVST